MTDSRSKNTLTAHDLIKAFAVIIMVIDHIGFYFFPEYPVFRAIGRIGFPVWFYLVGHARGRNISPSLLIGAGLLVISHVVLQLPMFPFNALVTIVIIRLCLDGLMARVSNGLLTLAWVALALCVFIPPTDQFTEYGTLALLFAMFGYLQRNEQDGRVITQPRIVSLAAVFCLGVFAIFTQYRFLFDFANFTGMVVGTAVVVTALRFFKAREYPSALPAFVAAPIRFMGHRTLEIYVAHLLLFKIILITMRAPS